MRWFILALVLLIPAIAFSQPINTTVEWDAVVESTNGEPLQDLSHYKFLICDGEITDTAECVGNLIKVRAEKDMTQLDIEYMTSNGQGNVYIRGGAVDSSGNCSVLSNQVEVSYDWISPKPMTIRIITK